MKIPCGSAALFFLLLGTPILPCHATSAPALRLRLLDRDATTTRFNVADAGVSNVNLEGSFDLENWFPVQSAVPVQGVASFAHTNTEPIDNWFFRAVAAPAPVAINVGPNPDTNRFVGGVVLPETGGRLEITDANGVFYQLTVRSNLVSEPTAIRMTVITNFSNMPLTNRFRAAVALEPDGLEFRGAAELKIRFPGPIPTLEMVGYGFDGSGSGFHLRPWDSETNEVTIAVSHFSGAGVAAEPFQATGRSALDYGRGLKYTRDAIQDADSWAGDEYRENLRLQREGQRTAEQAAAKRRAIKVHRNFLVYGNAIRALEPAAARDCGVGEVIIKRLEQLLDESAGGYGDDFFEQEAARMSSLIRCACARYYLELCEKDAISGVIATTQLNNVLDFAARHTGLAEHPDCDLGSDFDIERRFAKGKCHKPWEGTVRYSKVQTSGSILADSGPDSSYINSVTERLDLAYFGRLSQVIEQDGDPNGDWQSWTIKLEGKFSANRDDSDTTTFVSLTRDNVWTTTDTDVTKGVVNPSAIGKLFIRYDKGEFNYVAASAGLDNIRYEMPTQRTTERTVDCHAKDCPQPIGPKTVAGKESLYFAETPGITTPEATVEWQANGSLKIVLKRHKTESLPAPFTGGSETTETLTVQLWKGTAP